MSGLVWAMPMLLRELSWDDDALAPHIIWISKWISKGRLAAALGKDGKLHLAPELVTEVLSAGEDNARRDKDQNKPEAAG